MPRLRHINIQEYPYLTTTVTLKREPIFADSKTADILLEAIIFGREQQWYSLLSFVIMPDHMHLILIPKDKNISQCMKSTHSTPRAKARGMLRVDTERRFLPRFENRGLAPSNVSIKGFSAKKINSLLKRDGSMWQSGFYDYVLDTEEKVLSRMRYIEDNPVRKGLATYPQDYSYSSAKYRAATDFDEFFS